MIMKTNSGKNTKTSSKSGDNALKIRLVNGLLKWYHNAKRRLPWRIDTDPYHVWLSEIVMQQTRVSQGIPYFSKLIRAFPAVSDLAGAGEDELLRLWQGLGYYTRARNMLKCARVVSGEYKGVFPDSYEKLLELPGIGPYTAAAIASISFHEPRAVIDGNVYRVLSRIFGINHNMSSVGGSNEFRRLADSLIPSSHPGDYNQAMMELGALVCTPRRPLCSKCPASKYCYANKNSLQDTYPLKLKKSLSRKRNFFYYVVHFKGSILMHKRVNNDIWKGLYEFYLIENSESRENRKAFREQLHIREGDGEFGNKSSLFISNLSHQQISARFIHFYIKNITSFSAGLPEGFRFYTRRAIESLPKPVLIHNYLKDQNF